MNINVTKLITSALNTLRSDDRGAVLVLFAIALPVLLGLAALAVDGARMYQTEADLQKTADAAAMAGIARVAGDEVEAEKDNDGFPSNTCSQYSDNTLKEACQVAVYYAQKNMPPSTQNQGEVLIDDGVKFGCWNSTTRQVEGDIQTDCESGGYGPKAIEVVTERASGRAGGAKDNPLRLFLARAGELGREMANIRASTVAIVEGGGGTAPCFFAREPDGSGNPSFVIGSNSTIDLPHCVLGSNGTIDVRGNAGGGNNGNGNSGNGNSGNNGNGGSGGLQTVGGVTYRDYDGGTGNSDDPADDFENPGEVRELQDGEEVPKGSEPSDATDFDEECGGDGEYKGNTYCGVDHGVYIVNGDLDIGGNARFSFPSSGKSAQIYVTGSFTLKGTPDISGCYQISAQSIFINGNPLAVGSGCDDDQTRPFPGTGTKFRLVR